MSEWFETWFDSPHYHMLYNYRDDEEAEMFIRNIVQFLGLEKGQNITDMACGKGRHAKVFFTMGFQVLGMDLSAQSIASASKMSKQGLRFEVHDMRKEFPVKNQDAVFNIFTSLGYFDTVDNHLPIFNNVNNALKKGGFFVIDFLNANNVKDNLVAEETVSRGEVVFQINRKIIGQKVEKSIQFVDVKQTKHQYIESVLLLNMDNFKDLLSKSGFEILEIFGNYKLQEFNTNSPRLIIVAKKV